MFLYNFPACNPPPPHLPPMPPSPHLSLSLMNISHAAAIYSSFHPSGCDVSSVGFYQIEVLVSCHFGVSSLLHLGGGGGVPSHRSRHTEPLITRQRRLAMMSPRRSDFIWLNVKVYYRPLTPRSDGTNQRTQLVPDQEAGFSTFHLPASLTAVPLKGHSTAFEAVGPLRPL